MHMFLHGYLTDIWEHDERPFEAAPEITDKNYENCYDIFFKYMNTRNLQKIVSCILKLQINHHLELYLWKRSIYTRQVIDPQHQTLNIYIYIIIYIRVVRFVNLHGNLHIVYCMERSSR